MDIKELESLFQKNLDPISKKLEGLEAEGKTLASRLEAIEKMPLDKAVAPYINVIPKEYLGRKLHKQAQFIRELAGKSPAMFEAFCSEEKVDAFVKSMLNFICKATMNETTGSQGAYLVPDEFQWDIIRLAENQSYALQLATILTMNSDQLYVPAELTRPTMAWKGESVQMSQADATLAQVNLQAKKLTGYTAVTNELLQDSAIDVVGLITKQMAYGTAVELDNQMINGTGDPVSGLGTSAVTNIVNTATGAMSAITASDLSLLISKLAQGDLVNARMLVGRLALHYIRSLKDTNGQPIFANPGMNVPGTIYGFPYALTENIANTDGAAKLMGVFGDFKKFIIARRQGSMVLESNPYSRFDYNETQFRMVTRWAMAIGRASAFARITTP